MSNLKTIPETIRELFGHDALSKSQYLKDKANSFNRIGLIKTIKGDLIVKKRPKYIVDGQASVLFNALLINTLVDDPNSVKKVFEDKKERVKIAELAEAIFIGKQSVAGVAFCSTSAADFLSDLKGDLNLYEERLANPYKKLPNQVLGSHTSIVSVLLAQSQVLNAGDSVLVHFLNGDIAKANEMAAMLPDDGDTGLLREMIQRQYQQASEFDDLLDFFKKV
ncbi:MAG: hypothetical protein KBT79_09565 [Thalassolituus oleivorans]|nr:hypothetical protein [Thalassolituus oleivorans]